ncbi:MAG TPA: DUF2779 domain-containing protein [Vicinamibacterales bacterium]|nr:DUF2779 domain-containing protein [Vicinamibacterales bacterium]
MRERTLSKSDYKIARTCPVKLYFRENGYQDNRTGNAYLQLLADGGYMVEALAKARYPHGVQLSYGRDPAADFVTTMRRLEAEEVVLFEATLVVGRRMARVDILEKKGRSVRVIEAKAKSFDGSEHWASLSTGGLGVFRGKRKPHSVSSEWREKIEDVAYQTLLLQALLPDTSVTPWLALVDKSKRAKIDGITDLFALEYANGRDGSPSVQTARYLGTAEQLADLDLITEVDVSAEVDSLRDEVASSATDFEGRLDDPLGKFLAGVNRGSHCRDCEFRVENAPSGFRDCWGDLAQPVPHVLELFSVGSAKAPGGEPLVEWAVANGRAGLLDVPVDGLAKSDGTVGPVAERQRRQIEYTRRNEVFVGPNLKSYVSGLRGPIYCIDFECSRLALPYHSGMRPYGNVAFQWSCHIVSGLGSAPTHAEWLNDVGAWPNQAFADSLRAAIGDAGPVLTWSGYESHILREIVNDIARFGRDASEIARWVDDLVRTRVVDLHEWTKNEFFHPAMRGRTGIKYVMDAIWPEDAAMRAQFEEWTGLPADASNNPYASLPPIEIKGALQNVHEGTGAMRAYQEMMYGSDRHDPAIAAAWSKLLRQYCHLDSLSMVLIVEHWRRMTDR